MISLISNIMAAEFNSTFRRGERKNALIDCSSIPLMDFFLKEDSGNPLRRTGAHWCRPDRPDLLPAKLPPPPCC